MIPVDSKSNTTTEPEVNYKRKKSKRQVRDTLSTAHRWRGNSTGRFKPCDDTVEPEESRLVPRSEPRRKRVALLARLRDVDRLNFFTQRFLVWHVMSRHLRTAHAEQARRVAEQRYPYMDFKVAG